MAAKHVNLSSSLLEDKRGESPINEGRPVTEGNWIETEENHFVSSLGIKHTEGFAVFAISDRFPMELKKQFPLSDLRVINALFQIFSHW